MLGFKYFNDERHMNLYCYYIVLMALDRHYHVTLFQCGELYQVGFIGVN